MFDFSDVLTNVPDYREYLGVDELNASSEELAKSYPDKVQLLNLGKSRNGESIKCLKIGDGKYRALIYGFPNPEEPLGGSLLEYFCNVLAENGALLKQLDYTWYIIKCIDPDGARRNEGFLKGPFTHLNFAKNYYRTPLPFAGEMNFPYRHGELAFNDPLPETKALMKIMDQTSLDFISSLHVIKWGSIIYEVSESCPHLYPVMHKLARDNSVPLYMRAGTSLTQLAPGIHLAGYFTPARNYFKAKMAGKEVGEIKGAYVFEYALLSNPHVFMMIPECSLWYDDRLWDNTPIDAKVGEVVECAGQTVADTNKFVLSIYDRAEPFLKHSSPFLEMNKERVKRIRKPMLDVLYISSGITKEQLNQPVTRAGKINTEGRADVYRLFTLGGIIRMLDYELSKESGKAELEALKDETLDKLQEWSTFNNKKYDCKAHPIRNLIRMNLGSILHSAEYVKWKRKWNR